MIKENIRINRAGLVEEKNGQHKDSKDSKKKYKRRIPSIH